MSASLTQHASSWVDQNTSFETALKLSLHSAAPWIALFFGQCDAQVLLLCSSMVLTSTAFSHSFNFRIATDGTCRDPSCAYALRLIHLKLGTKNTQKFKHHLKLGTESPQKVLNTHGRQITSTIAKKHTMVKTISFLGYHSSVVDQRLFL